MLKMAAIMAFIGEALYCAEYATGEMQQHIVTQPFLWIWWVSGASWLACAIAMLFATIDYP